MHDGPRCNKVSFTNDFGTKLVYFLDDFGGSRGVRNLVNIGLSCIMVRVATKFHSRTILELSSHAFWMIFGALGVYETL